MMNLSLVMPRMRKLEEENERLQAEVERLKRYEYAWNKGLDAIPAWKAERQEVASEQ